MSTKALADTPAAVCHDRDRPALHRPSAPRPATRCRNSTRCATSRATSRTTCSNISTSISSATRRRCSETGGQVHWAATAEEARAAILGICQRRRRQDRHQGQVDDLRGDRPQPCISRPTASTPVETDLGEYLIQLRNERPSHIIAPAVHLTRDQVEADFRKAHTHLDPKPRPDRNSGAGRRSAHRAAAEIFRSRCRHHRRQFPDRRDRHLDHRHQRGQWRPDADPAEGAYRHRLDREDRADAGGCLDHPARAGALGDGPGFLQLHDALDRPEARRRSRRAGGISRRHSRQWPLRMCWAPSSRTCCAASAAAPASTIARSIRRSAAMPMAGSIPVRSARW